MSKFWLWDSIWGIVTYSGVLLAVATFIATKAINHGLNTRLEKAKGDINRQIEMLKIEQQKLSFNFEAYHSKKHEKYPELYKLVEEALQLIITRGSRDRVSDQFSLIFYSKNENDGHLDDIYKEDVENYCNRINMLSGDIRIAMEMWDQNNQRALKWIIKKQKEILYHSYWVKYHEANECFLYNALFLSENAAEETRLLLYVMEEYLSDIDPLFESNKELKDKAAKLRAEMMKQRRVWQQVMKEDLISTSQENGQE